MTEYILFLSILFYHLTAGNDSEYNEHKVGISDREVSIKFMCTRSRVNVDRKYDFITQDILLHFGRILSNGFC